MSDTNGKVKTYKNPDRAQGEKYKPYVPQYQVHGKEPEEYHGAVVPGGIALAKPSSDNPRAKRPGIRQPYAVESTSPIGRGRGPVPNVGNNMEHTWSNVDGDVIDDLSGVALDPNQEMIDNNDFVTDEALGIQTPMVWQNGPTADDVQAAPERGKVTIEMPPVAVRAELAKKMDTDQRSNPVSPDEILYILKDLAEESYLLMVEGTPVCSGPMEEIQDQARAMVFGEHEICDGNPVSPDDIVILKRVKVKVGLFLE